MAALSMVLGNLAALVQKNVKRLLAWSAVAQAGYLLTGMLADDGRGLAAVLFYSMVYAAGVLGAFAVVAVVERGGGDAGWDRFRGLGRRSPLMAACLAVFLLSLAGLPPTAGFLGKFYLFAAVLQGNGGMASLWLVIVGFGMSAVSFYYYLSLLKVVYGAQDEPCEPAERPGETEVAAAVGLALVVLGLGLGPDLLLGALRHAAAVAGF
jgi:NADH-quinone oxidoreductase subunit N